MTTFIQKTSGEREPFDQSKLHKSLRKAGASHDMAATITQEVSKKKLRNTRDIHKHTLKCSLKHDLKLAMNYNLKQALAELGPTGYPFEKFVAALLRTKGYKATTNQHLPGKCVDHEVDVVLEKENYKAMIECKFHAYAGSKLDVKIALYVHARFLDIESQWKQQDSHLNYQGWLATNTKFTGDAVAYSECYNMRLLGWGYPKGNIAELIEESGLVPITVIPHINTRQKEWLLREGIVVCSDILTYPQSLKHLGMNKKARLHLLETIRSMCGPKTTQHA